MGRTKKAFLTGGFTYLQLMLGMVSGFVLMPVTLRQLGNREYGLWLAVGEYLASLMMTDLGVFAVLPWVVAVASGRGDVPALRRYLVDGTLVGAVLGAAILGLGVASWSFLPGWFGLTTADRASLE